MSSSPVRNALCLVLLLTVACGDDDDGGGAGSSAAGRGGSDHGGRDGGQGDADAASNAGAPAPSCDVTPPTSCSDEPEYAEVDAIVKRRCLGCHNGQGEEWPLTSQSHFAVWYNEIRGVMTSCAMPPPASGITMPTEERELILEWIRCNF
jgi:hypothetical protein